MTFISRLCVLALLVVSPVGFRVASHQGEHSVAGRPPITATTTTTTTILPSPHLFPSSPRDDLAKSLAKAGKYAQDVQYLKTVLVLTLVHESDLRALRRHQSAKGTNRPTPVTTGPVNAGGLTGVVQCIKGAESGNYMESSHPGSGSGAYQFIPGTWRTWSAKAGFGGQYAYAYQAPAAVQDAVLVYTLTNGGAGNWSNRFGKDNCTAGLPGGG